MSIIKWFQSVRYGTPHYLKVPLLVLGVSILIGIAIQSLDHGQFVFADFFYDHFIFYFKSIYMSFGLSMFLGFGTFFVMFILGAYYLTASVSLILFLYRALKNLRYPSVKRTLAIFLAISAVVGFIVVTNLSGSSLGSLLDKEEGCPSNIVPESIFLSKEENGLGLILPIHEKEDYSKWADGTQISINENAGFMEKIIPCRVGSKEGENINHYYCDNLVYYKKDTKISEDGEIGKTTIRKYTIKLELKLDYKVQSGHREIFIPDRGYYTVIESECSKVN